MASVELCKNAGFCFGASKGVEAVEEGIKAGDVLYTYGPILNNAMLVKGYEEQGVRVIENVKDLEGLPKGKIIIRCHGVPRTVQNELMETGFTVHDSTCPFVKRIHRIVEKESAEGKKIIVVGNPKHPEVIGIVGWSQNGADVIEDFDDFLKLNLDSKESYCVVAQTTYNRKKFEELVENIKKTSYNTSVMNTICDATSIRQKEAEELSKRAEVMIVIGDTKSSNSKKLFDICSQNCTQTFFIQELNDIKGRLPKVSGLVGITAGASTPKYIIEEVQDYVRNDF